MKGFTKFITITVMIALVWANFLSTPNIVSAEETDKLNYLYLENDCTTISQGEVVAVSYGDEQTEIGNAVLTVRNAETCTVWSFAVSEIIGNTAVFYLNFSEAGCGYYQITDVYITIGDGSEDLISLLEIGMDDVSFFVNEDISTEDADTQVVSLDVDGSHITGADIQSIQNAIRTGFDATIRNQISTESGNVVVFLDPGHDSKHGGANKNGLAEDVLNLRIAQYCKEELESYYGVRVYMSRIGTGCPYPGTTSVADNLNRVAAASSVGANVYVSIHLNSSGNSGINGAEVFYPNANYRPDLGSAGANLATQIERQLVSLGLANRGISIRNSEDGTKYADGSRADYYGVIKNSKLCGLPGIIIEHAFVSGSNDAVFLKSESNLRALGIADATGIAQYFGLSKTPPRVIDRAKVEGFVKRMYRSCLNREPDAGGLKFWTDSICDFTFDGAQTAYHFVFSSEMDAKNLSNGDFVEILYNAFFGRASDASGKAFWVDKLDNGASRNGVFMGFVNSKEFSDICESYGIDRGKATVKEGRDYNLGLTAFISRLYTKALGRKYDIDGLNFWCEQAYKGERSIYSISTAGFFHSAEFLDKKLSNEEYIKVLYRTFLDREFDQSGYEFWLNQLATGSSRDTVLNEFANSKEFEDIKKSYGLQAK